MWLAQERNNEEAFKKLGQSSKRRDSVFFWRRLNYVTRKKRTRSAMSVQVEEQSGLVLESTTKDMVEAAIFREVHDKRYTLAKEAPICSGRLFDDFGYVANTPVARAVLDGTYQAPKEQRSSLMRWQQSDGSSPRTQHQLLSPQNSGRDTGLSSTKRPHLQNQGYTFAITLSGASRT
jgi:hypothetical protein